MSDLSRKSALYEGRVRHRRFDAVAQEFSARVALSYLDLGELEGETSLARRLARPRSLARYVRSDYLGDPELPLSEAVRDLVCERTGRRPLGPVRVLTNLRSGPWNFNPITLYYCFAPADGRLEAVAFEITNTPWGERAAYACVIDDASGRAADVAFDKPMHVSPFLAMDLQYRFSADAPEHSCHVGFSLYRKDTLVFAADLDAQRFGPLEGPGLRRLALMDGFMGVRTLASIYLHAARLALKGAPFHAHPAKRPATCERVR